MSKKVNRNFLEIYSLDDLAKSKSPSAEFVIELIDPANFQLNKFFYKSIGKFSQGLVLILFSCVFWAKVEIFLKKTENMKKSF